MSVTFSVGLPVYNAAGTVGAAANSVAAQAFEGNFELLIVDDGSTDGSVEGLNVSQRRNLDVRILRLGRNAGIAAARNAVLREARGTYLAWIDADDVWYPGKLCSHLASLQGAGPLTFSAAAFDWFENGRLRRTVVPPEPHDLLHDLLSSKFGAYLWSMAAPTDDYRAVGMFDETLRWLEDLDFMVRFAAMGGRMVLTGEQPLSRYNKHRGSGNVRSILHAAEHLTRKHAGLYAGYGPGFADQMTRHFYKVARLYAKASGDFNGRMLVGYKLLRHRVGLG